jgi:hypothetical protein
MALTSKIEIDSMRQETFARNFFKERSYGYEAVEDSEVIKADLKLICWE